MKKLILPVLCLTFALTSTNLKASNVSCKQFEVKFEHMKDRTPVKAEDLPEAIRKTLASEAYKGWAIAEAALVNDAVEPDGTVGIGHYEVSLTKDKEKRIVKFKADGSVTN